MDKEATSKQLFLLPVSQRWRQPLVRLVTCIVLIASLADAASAETTPLNVFVESAVDDGDVVGGRLAFQFREQIRRSSGMNLTPLESDAIFKISVSTIDPADTRKATVYSIVFSVRDLTELDTELWYLLDHSVGICGSDSVAACSESLVVMTDTTADQVRAFVAEMTSYLEEQETSYLEQRQ